ncbi:MAG: hypothetical protein PHG65_13595 [Kiritimatiellae bacterium]|nr:hypothetical protein [Kiritimatiellia bacterium]
MKKRIQLHLALPLLFLFCLTSTETFAWFSSGKDATETANALPPEYRAITNQIAETQQRYNTLIQEVQQTLSAARDRLAALQAEETRLTNEISGTESHIAQLQKVNEQRYQELEAQQGKLTQFEQTLGEKNARILQLTDAVQAEKLLREKEEETARLQKELDEEKVNGARQQERLTAEVSNLKNELDAQKKTYADQKQTLADLQDKLAATREAKETAETTNSELQKITAQLQEQIAGLQTAQQSAITGVSSTLREFNEFLNTRTDAPAKP